MALKMKPKIEPYRAQFWVDAPTRDEHIVFVTGNCSELGNWDPGHAFALDKVLDGEMVIPYREPLSGQSWVGKILVSSCKPEDLRFHYFIAERHPAHDDHALSIKKIESHHSPRAYVAPTGDPEVDRSDLFGVISDEEVEQIPGYLTDDSSIQFTLDPGGIHWQAQNYHERKFRVRFEHAEPVRYNLRARPEYKVSRYFREGHTHEFIKESKHGPLLDSQPMIYRCDMHVLEVCHVRVDFYEVGRDEDPSIPPLYFAYSLIAGTLLKGSSGRVTVPIRMPARQQVMRVTDCGELTLDFTIAKALPRCFKTARTTLHRPWQSRFQKNLPVIHIGHRGSGSSYTMYSNVCENTIESFNQAAEVGADFVEMDVMLDVDMIPIIYHDHTVLVKGNDEQLTEVAVKDLTCQMLCSDKVFHMCETDGVHRFPKTGLGAPFPTLEHALKVVDPEVGFHLDLKYPMLLAGGGSELNPTAASSYREEYKTLRFPFWSKNHFVDGILYILINCAGQRPITITCFDLDICIMLRLKQVQYPVFLLTSNDEQKGLQYEDVRINYLKRAIYSAAAYHLEGVVCQTAVMYQHSWFLPLMKKLKLRLICYGEANSSVEALQEVKKMDLVNAVIYDRLPELVSQTKDGWRPKEHTNICPPQDLGFIIGYTGFVPGRLDLVGTESAFSSVSSASDVFPDDDIVRAGYVSHRDKSDTCATYLWKIESALLLIKRRHGVSSSLFQGPRDTTWRFHVDWGDSRVEASQRYVKLTLTFVGNIRSQLRFQAGYEIFKGEEEFRRGHIDLDGSEYRLQTIGAEGGGQNQIEWIHHKDLAHILESSLEQNGSLYVGVAISFIMSQSRTDFRPPMALKNNMPDIPGPPDLILLGKNGLKVPAHKSYIATWSVRFRDEIDRLGNEGTLDLSQYHGQTLKSLVDFLYLGDLNEFSVQGHGVELLRLTEEYGLNILQPRLCEYLSRNMWREGLLQTFLVADSKPDNDDYRSLRNTAAALIRRNMATVFDLHLTDENFTKDELDAVKKRVTEVFPT